MYDFLSLGQLHSDGMHCVFEKKKKLVLLQRAPTASACSPASDSLPCPLGTGLFCLT